MTKLLKTGVELSEADTLKLIHELEVYKAELEMQNEELKLAKKQSEDDLNKYKELYDFAPSGYFTLSKEGVIIELNPGGAKILGKDRSQLRNSEFGFFISSNNRLIFNSFLEKIFISKSKESCEVMLSQNGNAPIYVNLTGSIVENGEYCLVNAQDITRGRHLENTRNFLLKSGYPGINIDFFASLARYLAQTLDMGYVCIDRLEEDGLTAQTVAIFNDGKFDTNVAYSLKETPCGDVVGKTVCCFPENVCRLFPNDSVLRDLKAESYIGTTLWSFDGKPIGLIAVIGRRPLKDSSLAEAILKLVAIRAGTELERKQAEEMLRQSEERYKSLFLGNNSIMLLIDPDTGEIKDANPAAINYYGWTYSEICSKNISEINTLARKELGEEMQKSKNEKRNHFFFKHRLANGEERDVEIYSGPIKFGESTLLYSIIHDITERRKAEVALQESEEREKFKLQSILSPEGSIANLELNDIIDTQSIQELMDHFYELVQIPVAIIDIKGKVLVGVGWQDICTKFHRVHPVSCRNCIESDVHLTKGIPEGEFNLYRCKNNMWDMATPIIIGGEHKGNLFLGQFFFSGEPINYKLFLEQAYQYGFGEQAYLDALYKAPRISTQKLDHAKAFLLNLSRSISQLSYTNIKLARAIAQQKKVEDELRESEQLYRAIGESMDYGIWICDSDGRNTYASESYLKLVGMTQEECSDFGWGDTLHSDDAENTIAKWKECARTGKKWDIIHRFKGVDGKWHPILARGVAIRNEHGNITGWAGINLDISELKRTEENLRQSEERHRLLSETMLQGVVHQDSNGRIISMNPAAEQILGKTKERLLLSSSVEEEHDTIFEDGTLFPGEQHPAMITLRSGESLKNVIMGVFNPSMKEYRWISIDSVPLFRAGEKLPYEVYTIFEDITERKQSEKVLRESEYFFRETQQAAFIGSYKTDFKSGFWESSKVLDQIFGIDSSYIRSVEGWLNIVHPDDRKLMSQYLMEEVVNNHIPFDKEYRIVRKDDGETRWVHGLGKIGFDPQGNINSMVGTVQEITARKAKEEELRKLNQTLTALNKSSLAMLQAMDEAEYLKQVCKIVIDDTDFAMVWIGFAEDDEAKTVRPMASAGFKDDYLKSIKVSWGDSDIGRGPTGTAIRTGKMSICNNMLTDPSFEPWREQALNRGYASSIVFPLIIDGNAFGAISIYSSEPEAFFNDEIKLLSELANDLALGITTIRLRAAQKLAEEALSKSHNELEILVKERTTELQLTNDLLRKEINIRKKHEQNLILAEEKYRTVADFNYDWEFWINPEGGFNYVSPSCKRITGFSVDEFINAPGLLNRIIFPADAEIWENLGNSDHIYKSDDIYPELNFRIVTKTGEIRWISCAYQKIFIENKYLGIRGSIRDITDKINIENKLLNITIEVEERERNRFSRELHDGLGPLLSTIKLYFQWLTETNNAEKTKLIIEKGNHFIESAIQTSHEMSHSLSSQVLSHSGYVKTVINYVEALMDTHILVIDFSFNSDDRFGYLLETTLYRITTELINNTIKYAGASRIEIGFNYQKEKRIITFTYSDDGIGFDMAEIEQNSKGMGLLNIQQRVIILKGKIQIDTSPGKGVKIYVELPVIQQDIEFESKTNQQLINN